MSIKIQKDIKFTSKAGVLKDLIDVLQTAKILPVYSFKVGDFIKNSDEIICGIQKTFESDEIIVRSSAKNEDCFETSNAGCFKSVASVPIKNKESILKAINEVWESYESSDYENIIFVQPMLKKIKMAGVAFTCELNTLAQYYIINYDESGKTDTITAGSSNNTKTFVQYKFAEHGTSNKNLSSLITTLKELEVIFNNANIDVEFAFDLNDTLYILQVRPIAVKLNENTKIDLTASLNKIYKKVKKLQEPHPNLLGKKAVFGVMPDWNPAEIIGIKPRMLALSLYKELVTDNIWAYQRDNYGYRALRSHPLLISFLGVPFIDVRVDFNSFIPKELNEKIADKLVNYYLDKLVQTPSYHDKVEFKIVHSCFYLNLPEQLKDLLNYGFNENEIKRIEFSLLNLTNNIICKQNGLYRKDLEKIEGLKTKFDSIVSSDLALIDKIYWLIEDCKRHGTLPFAGIARAAFIAVQFLKSFVEVGIMNQKEYSLFLNSINTVSKNLNKNLSEVFEGKITKKDFLDVWGHLRPGTYDILSLRYDEAFDNYFSSSKEETENVQEFEFSDEQLAKIEILLSENGLKIGVSELIAFIKEAIEGREYSKLVFTKSLSHVLLLVEKLGKRFNISREDLSFLDIKVIKHLYSSLDYKDIRDVLFSNIEENKEAYNYTKLVKLPSVIINPQDVYSFYLEDEKPNFITLNSIKAEIVKEEDINKIDVKGKIVFIKSADPGYDFLFTKGIAGLITQFGGANSHMAIRCAELGIPAVIGAGESNFTKWEKANTLEINAVSGQVRIIS